MQSKQSRLMFIKYYGISEFFWQFEIYKYRNFLCEDRLTFIIFLASWEFRNSGNTVSASPLLKSPSRKKLVQFLENRSKQLLKFQ